MWKQTEPVMLIICFYFNECINVFVRYTLYINVWAFLSLTALRAHRSSRSSSRQTLNTKRAYEAASPTSRTRRIQTCGVTSCVGTSRLIASPVWLLRSDGPTFCFIVTFSRGSSECYVVPKKSFYPRDVLCFGLSWSLFWSHISVVESYWCLAAWSLYREVTTIRKPGGTSEDICFSANPLWFSLVFMTLELVGKESFASLVFLFLFYVCEKTKI